MVRSSGASRSSPTRSVAPARAVSSCSNEGTPSSSLVRRSRPRVIVAPARSTRSARARAASSRVDSTTGTDAKAARSRCGSRRSGASACSFASSRRQPTRESGPPRLPSSPVEWKPTSPEPRQDRCPRDPGSSRRLTRDRARRRSADASRERRFAPRDAGHAARRLSSVDEIVRIPLVPTACSGRTRSLVP